MDVFELPESPDVHCLLFESDLLDAVNAGVQIRINNEPRPLKITLLTDDTTLFVSNETDIVNALSVVDKFSEVSGLYLNKNKI